MVMSTDLALFFTRLLLLPWLTNQDVRQDGCGDSRDPFSLGWRWYWLHHKEVTASFVTRSEWALRWRLNTGIIGQGRINSWRARQHAAPWFWKVITVLLNTVNVQGIVFHSESQSAFSCLLAANPLSPPFTQRFRFLSLPHCPHPSPLLYPPGSELRILIPCGPLWPPPPAAFSLVNEIIARWGNVTLGFAYLFGNTSQRRMVNILLFTNNIHIIPLRWR